MVISASHDPFPDNGIKLFGGGGTKLEARSSGPSRTNSPGARSGTKGPRPLEGHGVGTVRTEPTLGDAYVEYLLGALDGGPSTVCRSCGQCQRQASGLAGDGVRAGRRRGGRHRVRTRRDQHQRRGAARPRPSCWRARWSSTAPTSASRSTATPTGCWPWTRPARWSTATRSWRCSPATWPTGASWPEHRGGHRDDQPRVPPGHGRAGHPGEGDRRRRSPRPGRHRQGGLLPRGRAVRSHHLPAPGHHRRRPADRAGPGRPAGAGRLVAGRTTRTGSSSRCPRHWSM